MTDTGFESNGLLDFDETPSLTTGESGSGSGSAIQTPPLTTDNMDVDVAFADEDDDIFASLPIPSKRHVEISSHSRQLDTRNSSSPPPLDEEPEDWEDELKAMQEAEAEEDLARLEKGLVGASLPSRGGYQSAVETREVERHDEGLGFGDTDVFDFEPEAGPSKRTFITTHIRQLPEPECLLPPLLAETASGRTLSIKRRFKPKPRVLSENATNGSGAFGSLALLKLLKEVDELRSEQKAVELQRKYDEEQRAASRAGVAPSRSMWVDKYRPKQFADLIGEDRTHREVLSWLKQWDQCVYKRIPPGKKRKLAEADEANVYSDHLGRPRERVLLLSGPPGLGKTTLAQILARQAGYKSLEINASDDRNAATVTQRIKNAIEAGSGLGDAGRPVCVVIDEIDGATGGGDQSFIRSLIKLIQDVPANRKKNTPAKPLRRPIICICNDVYASSLRPLRPFARVVRFRKPAPQLLTRRLQEICAKEGLVADLRVLTTLGDVTNGDIRSCLNTLQFIKSRSTIVTDDAIRSSAVGSKDSQNTMHSVWSALFVPLAAKVRRKNAGIRAPSSNVSSGSGVDDGRYVDRICAAISGCGDVDRLVQGAFEHYPNLKPIDASLSNLCRLLDGPLHFYDAVSKKIGGGEYEVSSYSTYAVVGWYSHLAAPANGTRSVEWPKADYEAYLARTTNEEVATQLKGGLPPILRSLFCGDTVMTELVPLLMRIITPPLKPVNANIVKPAEKALLTRLVELMIPLGLSFWSEKGENGQPMMRLEPPIDCFVHYDGKRADDVAAGRFAVRQLVAQAMDAEITRRRGGAGDAHGTSGARDTLSGMYGAVKKGHSVQPQKQDAAPAVTDFFGRAIVKKSTLTRENGNGVSTSAEGEGDTGLNGTDQISVLPDEPVKRFRAVYKFNEGSSAAVRKGVKMSTLM